jgi:hypothetical protein
VLESSGGITVEVEVGTAEPASEEIAGVVSSDDELFPQAVRPNRKTEVSVIRLFMSTFL